MRRQRFQRGSLRPRKRNGKRYWYAQWREEGRLRSKELGLCSEMTKGEAEAILAEILRPINENAGGRALPQAFTFETFVRSVFLEVRRRQWKASTAMTAEALITTHLLPELGPLPLKSITREQMQKVLDAKARNLAESVVNHLRFHLRDIFNLALGERAVEYNPALALHTPAKCKPGKERRVLTAADIRSALGVLPLRSVRRDAAWRDPRAPDSGSADSVGPRPAPRLQGRHRFAEDQALHQGGRHDRGHADPASGMARAS